MKHIKIENNFISKVGSVVMVFILFFGFSAPIYAISVVSGLQTNSISSETLMSLTNKERIKKNLPVLEENNLLQKAAELQASDMIKRGYFSHNTPDGKLPWYWLTKVGYNYQAAGENLAIKFFDSKKAMKAWMSSPQHRQNILNKNYTEIGMAVQEGIYNGKKSLFVVQFFGTPQKKTYFL